MDWLPPSEPWRGLAASTVRAIGLLVVAFVFVGASGSFKAEASYDETSHVYDVLVITRVRADAIRAFDAASPPLNGARNESVSPPVDGSGPSTTSSSAFVATEAGGDLAGAVSRPAGVADDFISEVANNGKGTVWRAPGMTGNGGTVRIMEPTAQYPNGYVRFFNEGGQPLGLNGKPGPNSVTHIPINPDGTYPLPRGWGGAG